MLNIYEVAHGFKCSVEDQQQPPEGTFAGLFFSEPGVKVNGEYYQDVLLLQQMLPAIRQVAGENFVFQQDGVPANQASDTIQLLQCKTPDYFSRAMAPQQPGPKPC